MGAPTGTIVWDIETSGLFRDESDILSISASCGGEQFHSFVRPQRPIPAEASRINKIYAEDVADAPSYEEVALAFMQWVREVAGSRPLLVAYNGDTFDVPFLIYKNSSIDPSKFPAFEGVYTADPMRCAQSVYTRAQVGGSFRQSCLYAFLFGAAPPLEEQHTSRGDVKALQRIVEHETLREVVFASARPLCDITGQHLKTLKLAGAGTARSTTHHASRKYETSV